MIAADQIILLHAGEEFVYLLLSLFLIVAVLHLREEARAKRRHQKEAEMAEQPPGEPSPNQEDLQR